MLITTLTRTVLVIEATPFLTIITSQIEIKRIIKILQLSLNKWILVMEIPAMYLSITLTRVINSQVVIIWHKHRFSLIIMVLSYSKNPQIAQIE